MEIIPILAFIILVSTIGTFIFATAAYILYKIRESRGKIVHNQPNQVFQAEFVTPEPMGTTAPNQPEYQTSFRQTAGTTSESPKPKNATNASPKEPRFMRYTAEGYVPVSKNENGQNK